MVEKLKAPTPDGRQIPTIYFFTAQEAAKLAGIIEGVQVAVDVTKVASAEMAVSPISEVWLEEVLVSCGFRIHNVVKG